MENGKKKTYPSKRLKRNKKSRAAKLGWLKRQGQSCDLNLSPPLKVLTPTKTYLGSKFKRQDILSTEYPSTSSRTDTSQIVDIDEIEQNQKHYTEVTQYQLCYENEKAVHKVIPGHRIVDLEYVLNWSLRLQQKHSQHCTSGSLFLLSEQMTGLVSKITLSCNMCDKIYTYSTEDPKLEKSKINVGAVWGTLAVGSTFSHLNEWLSVMDIPNISYKIFSEIESDLGTLWHDSLWKNMKEAGEEERKIAIEENRLDSDGVPWITVYVDGGWSKRSYGHSYDAGSGVGVIIGQATGKVLFVGVRNKYCTSYARAANEKRPANKHVCFRNWSHSSPAMEGDIIVEGFSKSMEMHGVRYLKFIGDGDSSVFAKIRENVDYGSSVYKIECKNHAIKNYGKSLFKIKTDNKINIQARKLLTNEKIASLQKVAQIALYQNATEKNISHLKEDLHNGPLHIFGDHSKCKEYYCKHDKEDNENNITSALKTNGLYNHIFAALENLIKKSDRLIDNETSNRAETYMAIVARYNKGSAWSLSPWKQYFDECPGENFTRFMQRKVQSAAKRKLNFEKNNSTSRRKKTKTILPNIDYGRNAQDIEMTSEEIESSSERILQSMQLTNDEIKELSVNTIGQFGNPVYESARKNRLTASNFGKIIKRKNNTPCHNHVKQILYPCNFETPATIFGKEKERVAIKIFEDIYCVRVEPAGLFVDESYGFLAASPDGLINDKAIVEVKSLYNIYKSGIDLKTAIETKKNTCLEINSNGVISLKRNHEYYYQIQGQLNITKRDVCYFLIHIGDNKDFHVEIIERDEEFWKNSMLPKLIKFYTKCVVRELVLKNIKKGLKCQDPPK